MLFSFPQLLPNKQLRASVEAYLQRTRNEQADRERLAREAERLLKEKQQKREEEKTQIVQGSGQRGADAMLALDKNRSKNRDEGDEDDELGGDIFDASYPPEAGTSATEAEPVGTKR